MPSTVSSHLAAHSRQAQTTNAEGAPCWLDLGLCYGLGSPTAHSGQAQTTNAEGAPCWLDVGLCYGLGSPTAHLGQAQTTNAKRPPMLAGLKVFTTAWAPQPLQEQTSERKKKTLPEAISSSD